MPLKKPFIRALSFQSFQVKLISLFNPFLPLPTCSQPGSFLQPDYMEVLSPGSGFFFIAMSIKK